MGRMYLEPEESSLFTILTGCLLQLYFHGFRIDMKPYVVGGLMVSQLLKRFKATQPAVRGLLKTGQDFSALLTQNLLCHSLTVCCLP